MGSAVLQNQASSHASRFMVGRDAEGHWIVSDEKGLVGGMFADRASAVRFAMLESDHVPGAVFCAPDVVTINFVPLLGSAAKIEAGPPLPAVEKPPVPILRGAELSPASP